MASVAEVLEKAADLIEPEGAWTQGQLARGKSGRAVDEFGSHAARFCAYGAICRVTRYNAPHVDAIGTLQRAIGRDRSITRWNDQRDRTQAEVVSKLRDAAAIARATGAP